MARTLIIYEMTVHKNMRTEKSRMEMSSDATIRHATMRDLVRKHLGDEFRLESTASTADGLYYYGKGTDYVRFRVAEFEDG